MVGSLVGNYQLIRKLGQGGMGAVYLGQHTLLGRRAAIKVLLPALSARPDVVKRFFNEARAVTSISDPGIVQVFDFGFHADGSAFIVMEYIDGETVDRRLDRVGRLSAGDAMRLCRQLAGSLGAAHAQRIVHRDLKPENIFLVRDTEVPSGERSKIVDFGIAKLSDEQPGKLKTHTGELIGTPVYMSPEQCRGVAEIDHRSDIYSLGCVVFHVLTGRTPFDGEAPGDIISAHIREAAPAPSSHVPEIPREVDALVLRCLAKRPADRYQAMSEVATAAEHALQHLPEAAAHAEAIRQAPTTKMPSTDDAPSVPTTLGSSAGQLAAIGARRRRALWITAGLVVAAAVAGIAVLVARESSHRRATGGVATRPVAALPVDAAPEPADHGQESQASPPQVDAMMMAPATPPVIPTGEAKAPEEPRITGGAKPGSGLDGKPPTTTKPKPRTVETRKAAAPPAAPASKTEPQRSPAERCSRAAFAAVYNDRAASREVVTRALGTLKECHDAGAIDDNSFRDAQNALIARLTASS